MKASSREPLTYVYAYISRLLLYHCHANRALLSWCRELQSEKPSSLFLFDCRAGSPRLYIAVLSNIASNSSKLLCKLSLTRVDEKCSPFLIINVRVGSSLSSHAATPSTIKKANTDLMGIQDVIEQFI